MSSRKSRSAPPPVEPPSDKEPVQRPKSRKSQSAPPVVEPPPSEPEQKSFINRVTTALPPRETVIQRIRKSFEVIRRFLSIALDAVLRGLDRAKTFFMASRRNQIVGLITALVIVVLLVLIVVLGGNGDDNEPETDQDRPAENIAANVPAGSDNVPSNAGIPSVIAWENRESGGRLMRFASEARLQELYVAPGNAHVQRCGHAYSLPDQHALIVFVGSDHGDLVLHPLDGKEPTVIGQSARLTCAGPDVLQVFPNGSRIGYLRFDSNAPRRFRAGNLILYNMTNGQETTALDQATAFEVSGGNIVALRFYPDGAGNAAQADLDRWGQGTIQNITTLNPQTPADQPEASCFFISGDLAFVQNEILMLLGESCEPGGSHWRLAKIPVNGGTLTEVGSGAVGGGFYPDSFSTQIFPAADGSAALVAVPSGLERHIVQLIWVAMDGTQTPAAEFALADRVGLPDVEGRHLLLSPDGGWLAVVTVTRNREQSLKVFDLSQPFAAGLEVIALGANEQVVDYRWGPGGRLYFIAGPAQNNSLYVTTPGSEPTRISRGRYSALQPDATGQWIAVAEWVNDPNNAEQSIGMVSLIDLNGERTPVWRSRESGIEVLPLGVE